MDYKKHYEYCYNKTFNIGEKIIKETLIKSKAKSLVFYLNLNIINDSQNLLIIKKSNIRLFDSLSNLATIFENKYYDYTENNTELTIQNYIYPAFINIKIDQLPKNYSFEKFLRDFGVYKGIVDVVKNFKNNLDVYNKMYVDNKFNEFKIPKNNTVLNETYIDKESKIQNRKLNAQISGDNKNLNAEEKAFLFHIMCIALADKNKVKSEENNESLNFNLPFTELIRLNTIIDFKDNHCFGKNFGDSTNYKILTKGINHFEKVDRILFLSTLVTNIKEYQLSKTTKYIKTILNNEVNKNIKMKNSKNNT
ncbi:MAG: hypothetical protein H7195_10075 [Chryseobacterium sp.]|nr:hypothetical protein [Chryseobacterium sp.]